VISFLQPT